MRLLPKKSLFRTLFKTKTMRQCVRAITSIFQSEMTIPVHLVDSVSGAMNPGEQGVQAAVPLTAVNKPFSHGLQNACASVSWDFPAGQATQLVCFDAG